MKDYFEPEKPVSVRQKSQEKAKGKFEGCRLLPHSSPDVPLCQFTWTSQSVPTFSESFSRLRVAVLAQYVKATG